MKVEIITLGTIEASAEELEALHGLLILSAMLADEKGYHKLALKARYIYTDIFLFLKRNGYYNGFDRITTPNVFQ